MENKVFVVLLYKFCVVCSYVFLLGCLLNSHSDFPVLLHQHSFVVGKGGRAPTQSSSPRLNFSLHFIDFSGLILVHASHWHSVTGQTMNFPNPFSMLTEPGSQFIEFPFRHLPISHFINIQTEHLCL